MHFRPRFSEAGCWAEVVECATRARALRSRHSGTTSSRRSSTCSTAGWPSRCSSKTAASACRRMVLTRGDRQPGVRPWPGPWVAFPSMPHHSLVGLLSTPHVVGFPLTDLLDPIFPTWLDGVSRDQAHQDQGPLALSGARSAVQLGDTPLSTHRLQRTKPRWRA
jgi:hypothetical protein